MGCGQSKIGNLYPKNKKNKNGGSKRNGYSTRSASIEQKNGNGNNKASKTNNNGAEVNRNEEQNGSLDKSQAKKKPQAPGGGPLLQQTEISTSQLDFFRMLDEKIESGPDYDESADSHRAEHVTGLLRRWELASASWSNVVELNASNALKQQQQQYSYQQHGPSNRALANLQQAHRGGAYKSLPPPISGLGSSALTAKDREGMRNIIGGRPESAPVYVRSAAARVDGLQDVVHHAGPSPNMPRHVLESISQSPTQSLKTPPGISSPTPGNRYQHYHHPDFQQQQPVKVSKAQYSQGPSPLNGDYYGRQAYDSPGPNALIRNSPSNPYVQQFQITSSPQAPVVQQLASAAQRKRQQPGGFQMT